MHKTVQGQSLRVFHRDHYSNCWHCPYTIQQHISFPRLAKRTHHIHTYIEHVLYVCGHYRINRHIEHTSSLWLTRIGCRTDSKCCLTWGSIFMGGIHCPLPNSSNWSGSVSCTFLFCAITSPYPNKSVVLADDSTTRQITICNETNNTQQWRP